MTLRWRLKLCALAGFLGMIGLAILFLQTLPDQADEFLRRDAEKRMNRAATDVVEDLRQASVTLREILNRVAEDPDVKRLSDEDRVSDPSSAVDLASNLAKKYGLSNLVLIGGDGTLRSLHPEAARIGFPDPALLAAAKRAETETRFRFLSGSGSGKDGKSEGRVSLLLSAKAGEKVYAVTERPLERADAESAARRQGTELVGWSPGPAARTDATEESEDRAVALPDAEGATAAVLVIRPAGQDRELLRHLLIRAALTLAIPWTMFFTLLILWAAWPKAAKEENTKEEPKP